ncbi:hypothetical protein HDU88_007952 [Geranomyces variabilis]|nr:hypothetical protein HDU88_007952 [Geranomyces variabilis]
MTFGYSVTFTFLPGNAESLGFTSASGAALISVVNGSSAVGRIVLGLLADHAGQLNVLILSQLVPGLSQVDFWPFATTLPALYGFASVYGIFAGAFFSVFPIVTGQLFGVERIASVAGLLFSGYALGDIAGTPIAGALVREQEEGGKDYTPAMFYGGATMLVAAGLGVAAKVLERRRLTERA